MKKLASHHAEKSQKRLTLHRETLRQLDARDMERAVGGATAWYTCGTQAPAEPDPLG